MAEQGMLIIVSAPSGTGKNAIINELVKKDKNIKYSISATTRSPRNGEKNKINYFFITKEKFETMIINKELVEWDKYVDNYYGTPRKYIDECNKKGSDVILEITVSGAIDVKDLYPDAVMIYVLPPSMKELERRISKRGTEDVITIEKRMEKAKSELYYISDYEYVVINDDLDVAVEEISQIIKSERLKYTRNENILNKIGEKND